VNLVAAEQIGSWLVRVLLNTTLEHAQRLLPHEMATLQDASAGVEMQVSVADLEWMARFLINLGVPFVVREPVALRQTLRRLAAELAAAANQEADD
jgi:predicted DNA-binding transcriptional regulator YafY